MKSKTLSYPFNEKVIQEIKEAVIKELKTIYDPDIKIPMSIYDLRLIYNVSVESSGIVAIDMTLTTPGCPHAEYLLSSVKNKVDAVEGVVETQVNLVWTPPWSMNNLSEAARLELGLI